MEIRQRAQSLFQNFVQNGTLGEGAQRTDRLGLSDRMSISAAPMALEAFEKQDNLPGFDADPAAGSFRVSVAKMNSVMENGFMAELEQGFNELCGPTPDPLTLTPEQKAEMKESIQQMVDAGLFTKEEAEAMLNPQASQPSEEAKGGEYIGTVSKDADGNYSSCIETTGETHDVECFLANGQGSYFLNLTDKGDHFTASAVHMGAKEYKEEMLIR
ncbi:MAG: hypothetical protein KF760_03895 [Candidatus Eremiobacteraeota bacterium]|nr:hypothetical protein [Candidatus Eremiobacteraeota bacterium]MCW5870085.1 hypothetical protein [Candidatus Eremiobacteraeota bacterium]